jgi:hypothetical protein
MEIIYKKIEDIKAYSRNAKKHKLRAIKKSIESFNIDQPIVIDKNGIIIKGHGRFEAAKELGFTELPCIVRDDLSEQKVNELRIIDNKTAEGGWDEDMLFDEMEIILEKSELDFSLFGLENFQTIKNNVVLDDIEMNNVTEEKNKNRMLGNRKHKIKCVFYSDKVEDFEKAIYLTKKNVREEALFEIINFYLSAREKNG